MKFKILILLGICAIIVSYLLYNIYKNNLFLNHKMKSILNIKERFQTAADDQEEAADKNPWECETSNFNIDKPASGWDPNKTKLDLCKEKGGTYNGSDEESIPTESDNIISCEPICLECKDRSDRTKHSDCKTCGPGYTLENTNKNVQDSTQTTQKAKSISDAEAFLELLKELPN